MKKPIFPDPWSNTDSDLGMFDDKIHALNRSTFELLY